MKKLLVILVLFTLAFMPVTAAAHVLITDSTGGYGAVLHIMPGDDPIAGETAQLFFDIKGEDFQVADYIFTLIVRGDDGIETAVQTSRVGETSVRAEVIFPQRGVYSLNLKGQARAIDYEISFATTQRVSRGNGDNTAGTVRYAWAEAGLVSAITGGLAILIVCINRRADIAAYPRTVHKRRG